MLGSMIAMLVWLGLYPQPVLNAATPAIQTLSQNSAQMAGKDGHQARVGETPLQVMRAADLTFKRAVPDGPHSSTGQ